MSGVTGCEGLPYSCLSDPMQRHWIQDLAAASDLVLNRIASDVSLVDARPKVQMRRTSIAQATAAGSYTTMTYETIDYQPALFWADTAAGTIKPQVAGLYFVEGRVSRGSPAGSSYNVIVQYNSITVLGRKFDTGAGGGIGENQGVSGLVVVDFAGTNLLRMQFQPVTAASAVLRSRFTAQWLGRCNAPLNANPFFEKNITNWSVLSLAAIAWSTTQKYRGNASMRVTPSAVNWAVGSEHAAILSGGNHQGVAFVYPTTTQSMHAELRWYNGLGVLISTTTGSTISCTGTSWTMIHVSGASPGGAVTVQLVIDHDGAGAVTTYIDDAQVYNAC